MDRYVIGADLGGTTTRVLVADLDGNGVGYGASGGGNPVARGLDATVASLSAALSSALSDVPVSRVAHAVIGLAGVSAYGEELASAVSGVWESVGLTCPRVLRPDAEIMFASGTAESSGFVVVAGTGAVAGFVRAGRLEHSADGHGWLLGDGGSAFWIGRQAVRAVLADVEGHGPATVLRGAVAQALGLTSLNGGVPEPRSEGGRSRHPTAAAGAAGRDESGLAAAAGIRRAVYRREPIALAGLAPLVTTAADAGDPVARHILSGAADALLASLSAVHRTVGAPRDLPVVLGGGVLRGSPAMVTALRAGVSMLGLVPCDARGAAVGAVALAIRVHTRAPVPAHAHEALSRMGGQG